MTMISAPPIRHSFERRPGKLAFLSLPARFRSFRTSAGTAVRAVNHRPDLARKARPWVVFITALRQRLGVPSQGSASPGKS